MHITLLPYMHAVSCILQQFAMHFIFGVNKLLNCVRLRVLDLCTV